MLMICVTGVMVMLLLCVCVWYLRFLTADLHSWVFESDRTLPAPLGLILTFLESLNENKTHTEHNV